MPKVRVPLWIYSVLLFASVTAGFAAYARAGSRSRPSIDEISSILAADKHRPSRTPQTIAELLQVLNSRHPGFFSDFTLMRSSKSLQGAEPLLPRAIVFGRDARFILAFNGEKSQDGFESLEMIQFNDREKKFEFYELTEGKTLQLSGKNPIQCLACHQSNPRPNWEGYSTWPGAYGEDDDQVLQGSVEYRQLNAFKAIAANHPRYRVLKFSKGRVTNPVDRVAAPYIGREEDYKTLDLQNKRPNTRLLLSLLSLNMERLARQVGNQPWFKRYGVFALAVAHDCSTFLNRRETAEMERVVSAFGRKYGIELENDFNTLYFPGFEPNDITLAKLDGPISMTEAQRFQTGVTYLEKFMRDALLDEARRSHPDLGMGFLGLRSKLSSAYGDYPAQLGGASGRNLSWVDGSSEEREGLQEAICQELNALWVKDIVGAR